MGLFDSLSTKNKIRKLNNYKDDLKDDGYAIGQYNKAIDGIISDLQSFIKSGSSAITEKLYEYKEPTQGNDSNLSSARSYIQREINRLEDQLDD